MRSSERPASRAGADRVDELVGECRGDLRECGGEHADLFDETVHRIVVECDRAHPALLEQPERLDIGVGEHRSAVARVGKPERPPESTGDLRIHPGVGSD